MKLSVSLLAEDVAILDQFARALGLSSRSAALRHAVGTLRLRDLDILGRGTAWPRSDHRRTAHQQYDRIFPLQALLPAAATGYDKTRRLRPDRFARSRSSGWARVLGQDPADVMARLDDALRLHLQL